MLAKNARKREEKTSHRFGIVVLKTGLSVSRPIENSGVEWVFYMEDPSQTMFAARLANRRVMVKHQKSNMCVIIGNHQKSKHKEHDGVSSQIDLNVLVDRE